jgi:para-aminobenzoate synthetase/4-amino-4-deoxychorismate lyase
MVTSRLPPGFKLVETLRWTPADGYFLFERHLRRLLDSGGYFSFPVEEAPVRDALQRYAAALRADRGALRVRLTVDADGGIAVESSPLPPEKPGAPDDVDLMVFPQSVDSGDRFLFHKTTFRPQYDQARKEFPEPEDLLFCNERGELTETTIGNIVLEIDGVLRTPPVSCGLLAGVFRGELLETGLLRETVCTAADLRHAARIYRINSVRGRQACRLRGGGPPHR